MSTPTPHRSPAPPRRLLRGPALLLAALVAASGIAACGGNPQAGGDKLTVVAAFYPLQFAAEQVAGGRATVTNLVKPGAEPHDAELTASQVASIADADLVVYLKGFQPAVDEAVAQYAADHAFDAAAVAPLADAPAEDGHDEEHADEHSGEPSEEPDASGGDEHGHDPGGKDLHIWLDPTRLAAVADKLADRLGKAQPKSRDLFNERATAAHRELDKLDQEYKQGLSTCQRREIFTSHAAFGHLASRYNLEQIALAGLSPDQEPTSQRLAEVAKQAKEHGATVIFFETLVSPKVAEALAREVGAQAKVLDPIEGLQPDTKDDYFSVMRTNLQTLRPALGCS